MRYVESLNRALHEIFSEDDRVFLIGEDILDPYGGAFKVSSGLSTRFPERVLTTPLSENTLIGLAGGMALRGLKPIVEIMFGDFLTLGVDQIVNHLTKYRVMYAGKVDVPVVIRTAVGGGRSYGPTHSQSLEKMFFGVPHLKVVAPSRFHQPGELLKVAVADADPVLFIEHKLLYPSELLSPADLPEPLVFRLEGDEKYPLAVLQNYSEGLADATVITYGGGTRELDTFLLRQAQEEIRIRCIIPSLLNCLDASRLALLSDSPVIIIWEEGTRGFDWGAELLASLYCKLGSGLGIVRRLATVPTVIPAARALEASCIPDVQELEKTIYALIEKHVRF